MSSNECNKTLYRGNDDDHDFVVSMELNPSKARVLLQLALFKRLMEKKFNKCIWSIKIDKS